MSCLEPNALLGICKSDKPEYNLRDNLVPIFKGSLEVLWPKNAYVRFYLNHCWWHGLLSRAKEELAGLGGRRSLIRPPCISQGPGDRHLNKEHRAQGWKR